MDGQARTPHVPSSAPTAGDWHAPVGATTVWSANGSVMVATCHSRHLCQAGNAANARFIAGAPAMRDALERIAGNGCEHNTTPGWGHCYIEGRTPDAEFGADRCCDACIAHAALARAGVALELRR